jgi:hypothetical protein
VSILHGRYSDCRVILNGFSDCVESVFVVIFVEKTEETPNSGSGAVVVFGFYVHHSFLDFGDSARYFLEMGFGVHVSIENCVFRALLIR